MSQVRVHQLAAELSIESVEVIEYLESQGRRVRGPSTVLGESAAAGVRKRFRAPAPTALSTRTTVPTRTALPMVAADRAVADRPAAIAVPASLLNPFAVVSGPASTAVRPVPVPVPPAPRPVVEFVPEPVPTGPTEDDLIRDWARRDIRAEERAEWLEAGLKLGEAGLADQCRIAGIRPAELQLRLSGRSAVHRLRGGESATSVWARIQDGEHQPRRGTRLTGRFQLG